VKAGAFPLCLFERLTVLDTATISEHGASLMVHALWESDLIFLLLEAHGAFEEPVFEIGGPLNVEESETELFENEGFGERCGEPLVTEGLVELVEVGLVLSGENGKGVLAGVPGRYCFAFGGLGAAEGSVLAGCIDSLLGRHKLGSLLPMFRVRSALRGKVIGSWK